MEGIRLQITDVDWDTEDVEQKAKVDTFPTAINMFVPIKFLKSNEDMIYYIEETLVECSGLVFNSYSINIT